MTEPRPLPRSRALAAAAALSLALLAGCAGAPGREAGEAVPYTNDGAGGAFALFVDEDDRRPAALATPPGASAGVALARAESGQLVNPPSADLEALVPARLGDAALGEPRAVTSGALVQRRQATIADLRTEAARLGASWLIVARYAGRGRSRQLVATLHETATGREVARYGPSEPTLSAAASAFRQKAPRAP